MKFSDIETTKEVPYARSTNKRVAVLDPMTGEESIMTYDETEYTYKVDAQGNVKIAPRFGGSDDHMGWVGCD